MDYYHELSVSFNWWFLLAPLLVLAVFLFGTTKYKLSTSKRHIRKRQDDGWMLKAVVAIADVSLHILILIESGAGSMQLVANILGSSSNIAWMPAIMAAGYICSFVLYGSILYVAGKKGELSKKARLFKKLGIELRTKKKKRKSIFNKGRESRLEAFLNDIMLL